MRAINVFLCFVVSALIGLAVIEVGLRLMGRAPQSTINRFDPVLGWSKTPSSSGSRSTREFDVSYDINEQGLRDDPMPSPAKPAGRFRVIALGDSFVLGYTVNRRDLFVDQLEGWWKSEGRALDIVNAGTEGWSTDQEVVWFQTFGEKFQPDLVLLFPYENDLFWNSQNRYTRFPKPRFNPRGMKEPVLLEDPGHKRWYESFAIGKTIVDVRNAPPNWKPNGKRELPMEQAAFWRDPPEFMVEAIARTRGALSALKAQCETLGARLVVVPIPAKAAIDDKARAALVDDIQNRGPTASLRRSILGGADPESDLQLATSAWSPDQPVETFLGLCSELSISALDARPSLRLATATRGKSLYFESDWHFNEAGNAEFATFVHDALDQVGTFPPEFAAKNAQRLQAPPAPKSSLPGWVPWFAGLWIVLSAIFMGTYRDTPAWKAILGVGGMLTLIFTIAVGGGYLLAKLPPLWSRALILLFVAALFTFIFVKLGRRLGTIVELFVAFTRRGHWYLMPLVVVLLSIGSLLVVAASSPLVAPFIYTLF